jgi:hypothetical protein
MANKSVHSTWLLLLLLTSLICASSTFPDLSFAASLPNLTPYQPSGWSDKIVVSKVMGSTTDSSPLYPIDTLYVDWAVINNGSAATAARFYTSLYVDGVYVQQWYSDPPLNPGYYSYGQDYSIGTLSAGSHTIEIVADSTNVIAESNENDNNYTKTITVIPLSTTTLPGSGGITETSLGQGSLVTTAGGQISTTTTTQPAALANFGFTQNGVLTTEAGVAASAPTTAARIFVDYSTANGTDSGVAVVNPSSGMITLNVQLNNAQGSVTTCPNQTVPANGHLARFASQLCPSIPNPFLGTLTLSSSTPFVATTLMSGTNSHGEPLYNSLPVATPNSPPAGSYLYFSQFADGGGFSTEILLMNLTSTSISGTVSFTDDNGRAVALNFGPSIGSTSTLSYYIPGNGMQKFTTTGWTPGTPLQAGAVVVTSAAGPLPSAAVVFSSYNGTGGLASQAGVLNSPVTTNSRMYVEKSASPLTRDTGVAIVNPNSSVATVQLNLVSFDGWFTAANTITLPAYGHMAAFIDESALMGSAASFIPLNFQGVMTLSSNLPIAPVTLRLTANQRGEDLYSTLPVVDLNNPPTGPLYLPQIADGGGFTTQIILIDTSPSSGTVTMNFFNDSGGSVPIVFTPAGGPIKLNGVVCEAPLHGATVNFFNLNADGTKAALVGTTQTDDSGVYSVTLNSTPTGPILAEAKGGFYVDEVTRGTVTLEPNDQVTAIFLPGTTTGAITPLTDMAATRARTLAASGISLATATDASNIEVAQQFNLDSIIETLPVDASSVANIEISTRDERDYGFLLGGIAQYAQELNVRAIDLAAAMAADFSDGVLDGTNNGTVIMIPTISGGSIPSPFLSASKSEAASGGGLNQLAATVTFFIKNLPAPFNQVTYTFPSGPVTVGINGAGLFYSQNATLPAAVAGQPYSATFGAKGGVGAIHCSLAPNSTLPSGFALNGCVITSTRVPLLAAGTSMVITPPFTIIINDSAAPSHMIQVTWQMTIVQPPPQIIPIPRQIVEYVTTSVPVATATGGTPPYYYSSDTFMNGAPPMGMIVDLNGNLVGCPTVVGYFSFGVCVVDLGGSSKCGQTAVTVVAPFDLAINVAGNGGGVVNANPPPNAAQCSNGKGNRIVNADLTTSSSYAPGTVVTLTAVPNANSVFAGWSGDCSGTGACVLIMDSDKSVTATFNLQTSTNFTLTIAKAGSGNGTVAANPPGPSYASGTVVTLTATPDANSTFVGWSGPCSGTGTCTVTMNQNQTVTATFNLQTSTTFDLTVLVTGPGTVTLNPPGYSYSPGTIVTLTAIPYANSTFAGWGGACSGTGTCTVTMNQNQSVTATFNASGGGGDGVTPTISLGTLVGGCVGGSVSGTINITAAPGVTWTFREIDNMSGYFIGISGPIYHVGSISPTSGSGSGVVTVTFTAPPSQPTGTAGVTCSDTTTYNNLSWVFFDFSDGLELSTDVYFNYIVGNWE